MHIITRCPKCSAGYKQPEENIGRQAKCQCGHVFIVAKAAEASPTPAPAQHGPVRSASAPHVTIDSESRPLSKEMPPLPTPTGPLAAEPGMQSGIPRISPPTDVQMLPPLPPTNRAREAWAITALVCGILSVFLPPLIPIAVICGIVALVKINNRPGEYGGKGLAIAGIVSGGIGLVSLLVFLAMMSRMHQEDKSTVKMGEAVTCASVGRDNNMITRFSIRFDRAWVTPGSLPVSGMNVFNEAEVGKKFVIVLAEVQNLGPRRASNVPCRSVEFETEDKFIYEGHYELVQRPVSDRLARLDEGRDLMGLGLYPMEPEAKVWVVFFGKVPSGATPVAMLGELGGRWGPDDIGRTPVRLQLGRLTQR